MEFYGKLTSKEEFLYPDSEISKMPTQIKMYKAKNSLAFCQILFKSKSDKIEIEVESNDFDVEYYAMKSVLVESNTGDGVNQGGAMVINTDKKPKYATRLAPFRVFDCLVPLEDSQKSVRSSDIKEEGLFPLYLCFKNTADFVGEKEFNIKISSSEGTYICRANIKVYDIEVDTDKFYFTNWFSLEAISRFHKVEIYSDKFYSLLKEYAKIMRRMHQNIFPIELDDRCVLNLEKGEFTFEHLKPIIEIFFESGMKKLEIGTILTRGFKADGSRDMFTDDLKFAFAPDLSIESDRGYELTVKFIKQFSEFLKTNKIEDKVFIHVHDEPDIHYKKGLDNRKRQYAIVALIVKRYLPNSKIVEAVASTEFRGIIDILVCGTAGYEENKKELDNLINIGDEVWNYVCCGPEGEWLNRFLDFALLKNRLLFWGFSKNNISGFLHWGLNQFPSGMDPFISTSCPNDTGIGTNFPCGDSFIVYPSKNRPWISMRLEAQRRGVEDLELLNKIKLTNKEKVEEIISNVFTNNHTYNDDIDYFEENLKLLFDYTSEKDV